MLPLKHGAGQAKPKLSFWLLCVSNNLCNSSCNQINKTLFWSFNRQKVHGDVHAESSTDNKAPQTYTRLYEPKKWIIRVSLTSCKIKPTFLKLYKNHSHEMHQKCYSTAKPSQFNINMPNFQIGAIFSSSILWQKKCQHTSLCLQFDPYYLHWIFIWSGQLSKIMFCSC